MYLRFLSTEWYTVYTALAKPFCFSQVPWVILTTQEHNRPDPFPFPKLDIPYSMRPSQTPHLVLPYKHFSPVHMSVLVEEPASSLGGHPDLSPFVYVLDGFPEFHLQVSGCPIYECLCVQFLVFSPKVLDHSCWFVVFLLCWHFWMDRTAVWLPSPFPAWWPCWGTCFSFLSLDDLLTSFPY